MRVIVTILYYLPVHYNILGQIVITLSRVSVTHAFAFVIIDADQHDNFHRH
jgi:hypothetical protein